MQNLEGGFGSRRECLVPITYSPYSWESSLPGQNRFLYPDSPLLVYLILSSGSSFADLATILFALEPPWPLRSRPVTTSHGQNTPQPLHTLQRGYDYVNSTEVHKYDSNLKRCLSHAGVAVVGVCKAVSPGTWEVLRPSDRSASGLCRTLVMLP
jgi:hypothetical protein